MLYTANTRSGSNFCITEVSRESVSGVLLTKVGCVVCQSGGTNSVGNEELLFALDKVIRAGRSAHNCTLDKARTVHQ